MGWIKKSIRKLGLHLLGGSKSLLLNPVYWNRIHTNAGFVCVLAHGLDDFLHSGRPYVLPFGNADVQKIISALSREQLFRSDKRYSYDST